MGALMKIVLCAAAVVLSALAFGGESISRALGSIDVPAGQTTGDLAAVNGEVSVGSGAHVGAVGSVNGSLHLGANAEAASMSTVNGSVKLDQNAHVAGKVSNVNGSLSLSPGADVRGSLENVNGSVLVDGAHVSGTVEGNRTSIDIEHAAHLDNGIHIRQGGNSSDHWSDMPPRIVIGPGAVVAGKLQFDRKVMLYVSDRAQVAGPIEGATVIRYSGDAAPK
jgi:cytoskeletal protein CcmA (bactofilin family)